MSVQRPGGFDPRNINLAQAMPPVRKDDPTVPGQPPSDPGTPVVPVTPVIPQVILDAVSVLQGKQDAVTVAFTTKVASDQALAVATQTQQTATTALAAADQAMDNQLQVVLHLFQDQYSQK